MKIWQRAADRTGQHGPGGSGLERRIDTVVEHDDAHSDQHRRLRSRQEQQQQRPGSKKHRRLSESRQPRQFTAGQRPAARTPQQPVPAVVLITVE